MKKFISILFLSVLVSQSFIMASERTDFLNSVKKNYSGYYYSHAKMQMLKIGINKDNQIQLKFYSIDNQTNQAGQVESKSYEMINCDFKEFDKIRSNFIYYYIYFYDNKEYRFPAYKLYSSSSPYQGDESILQLRYTYNKTDYIYIPFVEDKNLTYYLNYFNNLNTYRDYIYSENLESISRNIKSLEGGCLYYDEYGALNLISKDQNYLIIDGDYPVYVYYPYKKSMQEYLKDKDKMEEYFYEGPYLGSSLTKFKPSSVLKDKNVTYSADYLNSFNMGFPQIKKTVKNPIPWVEGVKGPGIGESIEFDMPPSRWGWDIYILNGYVDVFKPHLFRENNRIKKARIETDTGESFIVEFNDCVEFKKIELSWKVDPKKVKITILEVYKGTKYDDTCITSIDFLNRAWDK